jgi:hypothetical protein
MKNSPDLIQIVKTGRIITGGATARIAESIHDDLMYSEEKQLVRLIMDPSYKIISGSGIWFELLGRFDCSRTAGRFPSGIGTGHA